MIKTCSAQPRIKISKKRVNYKKTLTFIKNVGVSQCRIQFLYFINSQNLFLSLVNLAKYI